MMANISGERDVYYADAVLSRLMVYETEARTEDVDVESEDR